MKNEENDLYDQFQNIQLKSKQMYIKIDQIMENLLQIYEQAQDKFNTQNNNQLIIKQLYQKLIHVKPLKNTKDLFAHQYKKLSKTIKKHNIQGKMSNTGFSKYSKRQSANSNNTIFTQQKFKQFLDSRFSQKQQINALQQMIVQHFLRSDCQGCSQIWPEIKQQFDKKMSFKEYNLLKKQILKGQFKKAIQWCESHIQLNIKFVKMIFQLKKNTVLKLIFQNKCSEALNYLQNNIIIYSEDHAEQLQKIVSFILFRSSNYWKNSLIQYSNIKKIQDQRYHILLYQKIDLNLLSLNFTSLYQQVHKVKNQNILKILYDCSCQISQQYFKMMTLMHDTNSNKNKQQLINKKTFPFSLNVNKKYHFHSTFICPVTKQVLTSGQKVVFMQCNHLISQTAFNRILQQSKVRKRIRCPVCQKENKFEQTKPFDF